MCLNTGHPCDCLNDGDPCEPCKMMAKDKERVEAHLSTSMTMSGQTVSAGQSDLNVPFSGVEREKAQSCGWMLSGILCLNILILGSAFVSGSAHGDVNIGTSDLQIYIIVLLLLTSAWMIYYIVFTARQENGVAYRDAHAGPVWLRGGLVVFGLLSLIMDIFKIASYVGYLHCDSAVKVALPVVQLVFITVQTYFLWTHAKDCVQMQKNITGCGLMLTLSTNLVVWMTAVTEESLHQTIIPEYEENVTKLSGRRLYIGKASYGDSACKCSHTTCSIFKDAYYYLYPFNIEYSLFASAMAYVMWKNISRAADPHVHHKVKFHLKDVFLGPVAGGLLIVAGLTTFIIYEMEMTKDIDDHDQRDKVIMIHFIMNIVIVTMMSVSTVIGCIIYNVDNRGHVSDENPTRSLDVGLLVGASLGQFIISYYTAVAMIATGAKGYLNRLNLAWAILMLLQLGLQNFFVIEGLHREPFHEEHPGTVVSNPYVVQSDKELSSSEESYTDKKPSPVSTHSISGHMADHKPKMSRKRWMLKEISVFLLLGNVILWIMPAFGARPQFDHDTETDFYGFDMWAAVVNVGLPFAIFYRMHSVASLFEVFLTS